MRSINPWNNDDEKDANLRKIIYYIVFFIIAFFLGRCSA